MSASRRLGWKRLAAGALAGHMAFGLAFAAIIYLVALTGTIAVFAPELGRWEQPDAPVVPAASDGAVARAMAAVRQRDPVAARSNILVTLPTGDLPHLVVAAGVGEGASSQAWFADADGMLVRQVRHPVADFVIALHANLLLPRALGMTLVGLVGIALSALIVSGILAHPRVFRDAFRLRLGGSARLRQVDMHNRLGTWGIPFHLVLSLTGALLGVSLLVLPVAAGVAYRGDLGKAIGDLIGPVGSGDRRAEPLGQALAVAIRARHALGHRVASIDIQDAGTRGARIGLTWIDARRPLTLRRTIYDGLGRVSFTNMQASAPGQVLLSVQPLHHGRFGGWPTKAAYGLLGIAMCVLTASGMRIWLARRAQQGRPSEAFDRLWTSIEWGQPCAIATAALAGLLAPWGTATAWLAVTAAFTACNMSPIHPRRLFALARALFVLLVAAFAIVVMARCSGPAFVGLDGR